MKWFGLTTSTNTKYPEHSSLQLMIFFFQLLIVIISLTVIHADQLEGNYFRHEQLDHDFRFWKVLDKPRSNRLQFNNVWTAHRMHDGYPIKFHNTNRTHQGIICMYPKGGSTLLKFLLRFGVFGNTKPLLGILSETPHSQAYRGGGVRDFRGTMNDYFMPRFLIVRNPYIRFLSAYLDKIKDKKDKAFMPPGYKPHQSFEIFVEKTLEYQKGFNASRWHDFNNHFTLMSKTCAIDAGMSYDYILPLEQMDHWYEPLIRTLGLVDQTRTGWNVTTPFYKGDPSVPCFYRIKGKTCEEMFQDDKSSLLSSSSSNHHNDSESNLQHRQESATTSTKKFLSGDGRTNHATNSAAQLSKYLNSPPLLAKLTEWMLPDLMQFRYPIWDGNDAEDYIKSLSKRSIPPALQYDGRYTNFLRNMTDI